MRKFVFFVLIAVASLGSASPVVAHGGGIDGNGGHYCREAGYSSGKCAPLGSYHCHQAGCVEPGAQQAPQPVVVPPPTTIAPPPPPPTTAAPTTTEAPTTTTTAAPTTTTTAAPTTTTTQPPPTMAPPVETADHREVVEVQPAASSAEEEEANPLLGAAILAAMGYGGFRLFRKIRPKSTDA